MRVGSQPLDQIDEEDNRDDQKQQARHASGQLISSSREYLGLVHANPHLHFARSSFGLVG
jgi:hypothetical protein